MHDGDLSLPGEHRQPGGDSLARSYLEYNRIALDVGELGQVSRVERERPASRREISEDKFSAAIGNGPPDISILRQLQPGAPQTERVLFRRRPISKPHARGCNEQANLSDRKAHV